MNKKGFTLVELLVTIAILGVITGLSIPLIRNIQSTQTNKKYEVYLDSVVSGTKLYIDSYGIDVFGHGGNCAYVSYEDLKNKNLIKDIDMSDVSCDSDYTRVKIVRIKDRYFYSGYLGCGKENKDGKKVDPTIFKPSKVSFDGVCGSDSPVIVRFGHKLTGNDSLKQREVKIKIYSDTGIAPNPIIQYAIANKDKDIQNLIQDWRPLNMVVPAPDDQLKRKEATGNEIVVESRPIKFPDATKKYTGEVYVVLKIISLQDLNGANWNSTGSTYYFVGDFQIDNAGPTFGTPNVQWVESTSTIYNSNTPKLNLTSVTDTTSKAPKIKYCYAYDNNTCPIPTSESDDAMKKYVSLEGNAEAQMRQISSYDGSVHKINLVLLDELLNFTEVTTNYKVSKQHTLTFDSNGGSSVSAIKKIENETWGDLKTPTKTGQTFVEWNTKADGTGTKVTKDTKVTGDLKVYAKWSVGVYTVSYNGNGATSGATTATKCTYGQAVTPATNGFAKTGHTFTGWSGIPAKCTGNVTLTATWKANTYKVSYAAGGGSGSMPQSNCTYGAAISASANKFTRAHYHFNGWSGLGTCTGNTTLTAKWAPNVATIRYHTGTSSGSKLRHKPAGWSIKSNYQIWNTTTQNIQTVSYGNKVNLLNYHNPDYLYIKKTSSSNGSAHSGKEWKPCNNSNCARTTYDQDVDYTATQICNTSAGNCTCCIKVNWR